MDGFKIALPYAERVHSSLKRKGGKLDPNPHAGRLEAGGKAARATIPNRV